jgi:general secretion pathway protein G
VLAQIRKARQSESGFTLIELLLVIVILGVLAGIVVFATGGINNTSVEAACKADLKTVLTASEAYFAQNGSYVDTPALVTAKLLKNDPGTVTVTTAGATAGDVTGKAGTDRDCTGITL